MLVNVIGMSGKKNTFTDLELHQMINAVYIAFDNADSKKPFGIALNNAHTLICAIANGEIEITK